MKKKEKKEEADVPFHNPQPTLNNRICFPCRLIGLKRRSQIWTRKSRKSHSAVAEGEASQTRPQSSAISRCAPNDYWTGGNAIPCVPTVHGAISANDLGNQP